MNEKVVLKNGQEAILRRVRGNDYDAMMVFLDKFSRGEGSVWTHQYPGQPKKDKAKSIEHYESEEELFLGIWKDDEIVAQGSIHLTIPKDPWSVRKAVFGLCMLEEYTSQGLGTVLLKKLEEWAIERKVHRICATVRHNNKRAIGLYLNAGYQIEGMAKETAFFDDNWQHEYYIAKLIPENC